MLSVIGPAVADAAAPTRPTKRERAEEESEKLIQNFQPDVIARRRFPFSSFTQLLPTILIFCRTLDLVSILTPPPAGQLSQPRVSLQPSFPEQIFLPNRSFPERVFSRTSLFPNESFPERIFSRTNLFPNESFPEQILLPNESVSPGEPVPKRRALEESLLAYFARWTPQIFRPRSDWRGAVQ